MSLEDYIPVNERIRAFHARYPAGSLDADIVSFDADRVVMKARAYRWPGDANPGVGHASEITEKFALENCETSAWGRALASLGFEVQNGVASREEMARVGSTPSQSPASPPAASQAPQTRRTAVPPPPGTALATEKQVKFLFARSKAAGLSQDQVRQVLRNTVGVDELERVPKNRVDDVVQAFQFPIKTGESDVTPEELIEEVKEQLDATEVQEDIPF